MHLFYTPDIKGKQYQLNETESKHCSRVLRLKQDDIIHLIDGEGGLYTSKIIDSNPKRCVLEITNTKKEYEKRNYFLHIAIAPTKNIDRTEWFLEKCTEISIDEISPILSQHSERKVIKHDRLFKVITSAVKQSLKAYHPKLNPITKFKDLVEGDFQGKKYIAHCNPGNKQALKNICKKGDRSLVLIGPEGDFSPEEVELAVKNGFVEISLGTSRLRTETAGIVACHTINLENQ